MIGLIDQSSIELRALRALVTVADRGSFRGAARTLGYTQSAISHQIASLERALDADMFTRPGGRGAVTLTAAGDAAYRRARRVLGEIETLGADVAAIERGERPTLRIGVFQTATTELLPSALRTLRENRPDVEVIRKRMAVRFSDVRTVKPDGSRAESTEIYLAGKGFA